ncbi:MAG: HupE/UreJ family protein [Geminicoccaceae bacterium]
MRRIVWLLLVLMGLSVPAAAHPIRSGYLEVSRTAAEDYHVRWTMPTPDGVPSGIDIRFDPRCTTGEAPVVADTMMRMDRSWTLHCAGGLAGTQLAAVGLDPGTTDLLVRILDGSVTVSRLTPNSPALTVPEAAAASSGAAFYFRLGVEHILFGADHLLFVLGLLLIVRDRWMLVKTITAFTVAHSITLAAATLGVVQVPAPPLNAAIALSILCLGIEVARSWRGQTSLALRHPWLLAFAFGLLHGLGYASGLLALGLPRADIPLALLLFNLGVEAGQLLFVALILLLERAFRLLEIDWPRPVRFLPVYLVGTLGAYWTIDRVLAMVVGIG